jgi:TPR repeat protein
LGLDTVPERKPVNDPTLDTLRDRSFSGLDYFYEPEEKSVGGRQILLLLVLLAALGAAGWWTYKNYLGAMSHPTKPVAANPVSEPAADNSAANSVAKTDSTAPATPQPSSPTPAASTPTPAGTPSASAAQPSTPPPATPRVQAQKPNPPAIPARKEEIVTASRTTPAVAAKPTASKGSRAEAGAEPPAEAPTNDSGDAAYRKAEALLYGRGVSANCDEAVKYLKEASAQQNAKARSMFGTMYATGHCVPRDLPTSYSWFALALHVDPNNQILEKDLTAIWNQMTPPERQLATKMKP